MPKMLPIHAEFQVPMQGKYLSLVRKGVKSLAAGAGFGEDDCQDIEVAIGEAVTNAICHGRPQAGAGSLRVRCYIGAGQIRVEVEDEGRTTCVPLPQRVPDPDNEHGRGWFLIHRLMDGVSVSCSERGLLVRMVKRSRSSGGKKRSKGVVAVA
ncbi:MAG: ATP-binding protein [Armatimonadetes bacterium]|nr:ATP-binding protein [Armatimonadota bacterium]